MTQHFRKRPIVISAYRTEVPLAIHTLEGTMQANAGDWIITGVQGEQYPCKPEIFEATYELVEEETKPSHVRGFLGSTPGGDIDDSDRDCNPGDTGDFIIGDPERE